MSDLLKLFKYSRIVKYSYLTVLALVLVSYTASYLAVSGIEEHHNEQKLMYATIPEILTKAEQSEEQVYMIALCELMEGHTTHSENNRQMITIEFERQANLWSQIYTLSGSLHLQKISDSTQTARISYRETIRQLLAKNIPGIDADQRILLAGSLSAKYSEMRKTSEDLRSLYQVKLASLHESEREHLAGHIAWYNVLVLITIPVLIYLGFVLRSVFRGLEMQNQKLTGEISERKKIQDELTIAKETAEEANRLKTAILANMSHELRTPMTGILGYAELILMEAPNDDICEMAERLKYSANRLMTTLNLIINLSRVESGRQVVIHTKEDLLEIIRLVCKKQNDFASGKSLYLTIKTDFIAVFCEIDRQMVFQIIENLVNNAIKYTEKGGVVVELSSEQITDNFHEVIIRVTDTGIGIKPEHINQIWEHFRQASEGYTRSYEGNGLGLTLSKKYTERLNGRISVTSTPGEGSTFELRFPALKENIVKRIVMRPVFKETDTGLQVNRKPLLLLVEDDQMCADLAARTVAQICRIDLAPDSVTALTLIKKHKYDIIIMDINLGFKSLDGITTTQLIRQIEGYQETPIICVTAFTMPGDKEAFLESGCTQYLAKPYTSEQLLAEIEAAMGIIKAQEQYQRSSRRIAKD
ncbi:MAG: ATP-binding protein [Ignavibacteriaceae bacterium]|nr:ATP-binding protein [Ignavibacteriaceae bacterium]